MCLFTSFTTKSEMQHVQAMTVLLCLSAQQHPHVPTHWIASSMSRKAPSWTVYVPTVTPPGRQFLLQLMLCRFGYVSFRLVFYHPALFHPSLTLLRPLSFAA